jgi:hypothetical protein
MKPNLSVIGSPPATDTVQTLEYLLDLARRGELIGIAFVGMYKRRRIQTGTTGEASRSPVFTIGAVRVLEQSIIHHLGAGY